MKPTLLVDPQEASQERPPVPEWLSDLEDHPRPSVPKETSLQSISQVHCEIRG